jgi:hypothetical protein
MRVGQINIFGVTEQALPYPPGLATRLQKRLPDSIDAASCQDYQYLSGALGAPETYFFQFPPNNSATAPPQKTYDEAFLDCNDTGSYLAIPQTVGEAAGLVGTSNPLMRQCNLLTGTDEKECWVGARDTKYNELYTDRYEMINGCTTCFEPEFCRDGTCPISFSTYPGAPLDNPASAANYRAPAFPGQISSKLVLDSLFPVANGIKTFYTQLGTGVQTGCIFDQAFELGINERTKFFFQYGKIFYFVTFRVTFRGDVATPATANDVEAILSSWAPILNDPSQTSVCPPNSECKTIVLKSGIGVPDIEYGEQFKIDLAFCILFQWGPNLDFIAEFCSGFMTLRRRRRSELHERPRLTCPL